MPIAGPAGPEIASPPWAAGGSAIIAFLSEGPGWPDLNIVEDRRQSSLTPLTPVLHRPNLALVTGVRPAVRVERGPPQVRRRQLPCASRPPA
jgi:hypothetical protein